MTVTLHLYEADGTLVRNLTTATGITWSEREGTDGSGSATFKFGDPALADLRVPDRIVVVRIDGTDVWAWLTRKGVRLLSGKNAQNGGDVEVSGPGLRKLLSAAKIYPPVDCVFAEDLRERTFGVPDPSVDTSGLPNAVSFGAWHEQPFDTLRPEGFPDRDAQLITLTTDAVQEKTYYLISPDFTVSESKQYVWCRSSDDEYDDWCSGMVVGQSRGAYKWKTFDPASLYLCTGETFRLVMKVHNLNRTLAATNFTWGIGSLMPAGADGKPQATNTLYHVDTTADGGTFRLSVNGNDTTDLAWDISGTNLQTALEGLAGVGAGNVTVSGSGQPAHNNIVEVHNDATGGTFRLSYDGQFTGNIAYNASAATVKAAVEALSNVTTCTVSGAGNDGDPWRIEITDPATTSFTVGKSDALTGGSETTTITTVHSGNTPDPWIIEFVGILAGTPVTVGGNGSGLSSGVLTVSPQTVGSYAEAVIHTDTDWKVLEVDPTSGAGMNFGEMFDVALGEAQARGVSKLDHFTTSWTAANDSGGVAWGFEYELTVPVEKTSLLDLLKQGEADGYDARINPDRSIDVEDERGTDRTATITLQVGDRINAKLGQQSRWEWDWEEPVNVVRSFDLQGKRHETPNATSVTAHGRYEDWLDLEGASAPLVKYRHSVVLKDGATPYEPARWVFKNGYTPGIDFHWGDLVGGEDISGTIEVHRVTGWEAKVDDDNGLPQWSVESVVQ